MKLTDDYHTPLILCLDRWNERVDSASDLELAGDMLETCTVASFFPCDAAEFPYTTIMSPYRELGDLPDFHSQLSRVTLHVFVGMVELLLGETSSFSTEHQTTLREVIGNPLLGLAHGKTVSPALTRECALSADTDPVALVEWILTQESSTRNNQRPYEFVKRIMDCDNSPVHPWFEILRTNPVVTEMVNAWYEVNKVGRKELLKRRNNASQPRQFNSVSSNSNHDSNNDESDSIVNDSTVLLLMVETAASQSIGATFLLLREWAGCYFEGLPVDAPHLSSSTTPARVVDPTVAHALEVATENDLIRVFTRRLRIPGVIQSQAAEGLKKISSEEGKGFFYRISLRNRHYPHEKVCGTELTQYCVKYMSTASSAESGPPTVKSCTSRQASANLSNCFSSCPERFVGSAQGQIMIFAVAWYYSTPPLTLAALEIVISYYLNRIIILYTSSD